MERPKLAAIFITSTTKIIGTNLSTFIRNQTSYNLSDDFNAVINISHPSVKNILKVEDKSIVNERVRMLYQIVLLAQGKLQGKNLTDFINSLVRA